MLPRTSISRRRIKDLQKKINATLSYAIRTETINIEHKHQSVTNIFEYKLKVMILVQIATEIWNDAISIDIKNKLVLKEAAIESLSTSPSNVIIQSYNNYLQDPKITVLPIGFFVASPMLSTHVPSLSSYTPTDTVSSYNTHYPLIDYQLDRKHKHNVQNIIKLPH
jgi:hypothetical protein